MYILLMSNNRANQYRVMWVFVMFDLPTATKKDIRIYNEFRKRLLNDGFVMFQFSMYVRHCYSAENAQTHVNRVKGMLPEKGKVGIMCITDKQFSDIQIYFGNQEQEVEHPCQQLELELF